MGAWHGATWTSVRQIPPSLSAALAVPAAGRGHRRSRHLRLAAPCPEVPPANDGSSPQCLAIPSRLATGAFRGARCTLFWISTFEISPSFRLYSKVVLCTPNCLSVSTLENHRFEFGMFPAIVGLYPWWLNAATSQRQSLWTEGPRSVVPGQFIFCSNHDWNGKHAATASILLYGMTILLSPLSYWKYPHDTFSLPEINTCYRNKCCSRWKAGNQQYLVSTCYLLFPVKLEFISPVKPRDLQPNDLFCMKRWLSRRKICSIC